MSYSQYSEFEDYYRRANTTQPFPLASTAAYTLAAIVFGAAVLDHYGYPPRYIVYRLVRMATEIFGLEGTFFDQPSDSENGDGMLRSGGVFGSLFSLPSPTSIIQKGVRGVTSALSAGAGDRPPGLGNRNNACYQNSVMQGLASLHSLRDYLTKTTSEHAALDGESVNGALLNMIRQLTDTESKSRTFWIQGKLKSMSVWEQQDAQEYYSKILDALDEEIKKVSSSKRRSSVSFAEATKSLVDASDTDDVSQLREGEADPVTDATAEKTCIEPNPLDGLLAQRVGCVSCGYSEGLTLIPSNCITVPLGRNYGYDIRECLDEYTALEYIDDVECAKCTLLKMKNTLAPLAAKNPTVFGAKLDAVQEALDDEDFEDKTLIKTLNVAKKNWVKSRKSKQAVVARAPKALVLHINRSSFNEYTGEPVKNTAGVSYPSTLDLGNWCLGNSPSGSQHPDMSLEQWPRDPNKSMLLEGEPMETSPFQYQLRAAVIHSGTHGYGHYVCYRPHPAPSKEKREDAEMDEVSEVPEEHDEEVQTFGEQWWRFSDDSVYAVSEEDAHQGNVFMLFYERVDESPSQPVQEAATTMALIPLAVDAPLPPASIEEVIHDELYDIAVQLPLPEHDDLLDLIPPTSEVLPAQPNAASKLATSDNAPPLVLEDESEQILDDAEANMDVPAPRVEAETPEIEMDVSTQLTSDNESESELPAQPVPRIVPVPQVSPHLMRTAGNAAARGQGKRQSLPLVSAT